MIYLYTANLKVAFSVENKLTDDEVKEMFLEWLGSVSDTWVLEGLSITEEEE